MRRRRWSVTLGLLLVAVLAQPAAAAPPPLPVPTGLSVTSVTSTTVGLAWTAVSGATSYQVLRAAPGGSLAVVSTAKSTSYADAGLAAGTTYSYAVTAVSKKGTSAPSATVTATTVPGPPTALTATAASPASVAVGWTGSTGAVAYQVWRSTGTAGPALVATVGATSYSDTGLTAQTTYRYTVRATNVSGASGDSGQATVTTPAVTRIDPSINISQSLNPSVNGDRVVFTVRVWGEQGTAVPSGAVTLTVQNQTVRSVLNPNGVASFDWIFSTEGYYLVKATYEGDARYTSAWAAVTQVVHQATGLDPYQAFVTGSWATSVVAADVDGNGRKEAVVVTGFYFDAANDYSLFVHDFTQGAVAPSVTKVPTGNAYADSEAAAVGDLDGDGTDDVIVATAGGVKVFLGSPTGLTRTPVVTPTVGAVTDVLVAELTGDGHPDVLVSVKGPSGGEAILLAGQGDGTFTPGQVIGVPRTANPVLAAGDVTGDGHDDVVLLWDTARQVEVLTDYSFTAGGTRGNWDTWSNTPLTGTAWPDSVAAGDVSGDGRVDVVVTAGGNVPGSQLIVVQTGADGRAELQYTLGSKDIPEPVVVADTDGDHLGDVVTAHGGWNSVGIYRQKAAGGLANEQLFTAPYASHYEHRGLAVGDVTGDGRADVLLADYNHGLVLLAGACPAYCGT
jgi:fibronectin type 3 domain-containing protein